MSDNNEKPASTWGGGDSEAETRIAGGSTPAAEPNPVHDHTQRFENDATQVAYRDQPQAAAQPGQSPARTESPTQASSAHSQAYPSAPIAQQQSAPYAQGYPGAAGQQGQYGAGQQYGSAPQGGQYNSAPQGQYGAGQQYNSSPQGGQQYGSAPQGGHAQPGQYNSSPQGGQQYGSAPQGGQYNSAPQGGYAQPGQYSSSPQGGQTYGSGQHTTPAHGGQQGQYTSAAYGQSQSAQPTKTSSASPVAKFGPFLPALLALIAPFVAWVTFKSGSETVALNGIGGNSNSANPTLGESSNTGGIFVLILAIGLAVAGVLAALGKLNAKVTGIVTAALGVVLLIIGILQFPSTASAVGDGGAASGYSATIGAGVWLTLLAGLAALAVGVVAFLQSRKGSSASATNGGQQWNGGYQQGQQQFGQGNGQQYGSAPQGGFGQNH